MRSSHESNDKYQFQILREEFLTLVQGKLQGFESLKLNLNGKSNSMEEYLLMVLFNTILQNQYSFYKSNQDIIPIFQCLFHRLNTFDYQQLQEYVPIILQVLTLIVEFMSISNSDNQIHQMYLKLLLYHFNLQKYILYSQM